MSMLDATIFSMLPREGFYFSTGKTPDRLGNAHYQLAPWNSYETSDMRHMIVVAHTEKYWRALAGAIDLEDLASDPRFVTNKLRLENRDALDAILAEALAGGTLAQWSERLTAAEVLFATIRDFDDVFSDPSVRESMVAELEHPTAGKISVLRNPIRLAENPTSIDRPPPCWDNITRKCSPKWRN